MFDDFTSTFGFGEMGRSACVCFSNLLSDRTDIGLLVVRRILI